MLINKIQIDTRIEDVKTVTAWNQTCVCFHGLNVICSKPRTADLKEYEKVVYNSDFQPLYGIKRLKPEQEKPKPGNNGHWYEVRD